MGERRGEGGSHLIPQVNLPTFRMEAVDGYGGRREAGETRVQKGLDAGGHRVITVTYVVEGGTVRARRRGWGKGRSQISPQLNLLRGSSGPIPAGVWRDWVIWREASTRPRGEPREKK